MDLTKSAAMAPWARPATAKTTRTAPKVAARKTRLALAGLAALVGSATVAAPPATASRANVRLLLMAAVIAATAARAQHARTTRNATCNAVRSARATV